MKHIIFAIVLMASQAINMQAIAKNDSSNVDLKLTLELNELKQEKLSIESKFKVTEAACYRKFAVNNCLQEVKSEKILALTEIKRRELEINDQQRQLKADAVKNKSKKMFEKEDTPATTSKAEKPSRSANIRAAPVPKDQNKLTEQRALAAQQRVLDASQKRAASQQKTLLRAKKLSQVDEQTAKFSRKTSLAEKHKNDVNQKMEAKTKPKSVALPVPDLSSR